MLAAPSVPKDSLLSPTQPRDPAGPRGRLRASPGSSRCSLARRPLSSPNRHRRRPARGERQTHRPHPRLILPPAPIATLASSSRPRPRPRPSAHEAHAPPVLRAQPHPSRATHPPHAAPPLARHPPRAQPDPPRASHPPRRPSSAHGPHHPRSPPSAHGTQPADPRAGRRRCWFGEREATDSGGHGKQREDPGLARRRPLAPPESRHSLGESNMKITTDGAASTCPGRTRVAGTRCPPLSVASRSPAHASPAPRSPPTPTNLPKNPPTPTPTPLPKNPGPPSRARAASNTSRRCVAPHSCHRKQTSEIHEHPGERSHGDTPCSYTRATGAIDPRGEFAPAHLTQFQLVPQEFTAPHPGLHRHDIPWLSPPTFATRV